MLLVKVRLTPIRPSLNVESTQGKACPDQTIDLGRHKKAKGQNVSDDERLSRGVAEEDMGQREWRIVNNQ